MLPLNKILPAAIFPWNALAPCTYKSPVIPTPPPSGTTNAPVVKFVAFTPEAATIFPLAVNNVVLSFLLKFQLSLALRYVRVAPAPATVSPAPFASAPDVAFAATVILRSSMSSVSTFSVVVFPRTSKLPSMVTFPPTFKLAAMPTPPVTTTAPVDTVSLCVAFVKVVNPFEVSVVNAPESGVAFPILKLLALPPVITLFPELKLSATKVEAEPLVIFAVVVFRVAVVVVPASMVPEVNVVMLPVVLFRVAVVVVPASMVPEVNVVMLPVVLFRVAVVVVPASIVVILPDVLFKVAVVVVPALTVIAVTVVNVPGAAVLAPIDKLSA